MKFLIAILVTALSVFVVSTLIGESLFPRGADKAEPAQEVIASAKPSKSKRRTEKSNSDAPTEPVSGDWAPANRTRDALPLHKMAAQNERTQTQIASEATRQDGLQFIIDEIRSEQQALEKHRQEFDEAIARAEERSTPSGRLPNRASDRTAGSPPKKPAQARVPRISRTVPDRQAASDAAILVRALSDEGNLKAAMSYLSQYSERDAAKVLAALSTTDPQLAIRLSDTLLANRPGDTRRN